MSTIKVTNIQSPNSGTNDIIIDASGNVTATGTGPHSFGMLPNLYTAAVRTTDQNISSLSTVIFDSELKDPYNLYDNSTGIFTVTADTVGTYLVLAGLNIYSMQSPSGESTFLAGIYKNDTTDLQYQEIWETSNPDETSSGLTLVTIAQLGTAGDNVRIKAHLITTSSATNLLDNSSLTILRLF